MGSVHCDLTVKLECPRVAPPCAYSFERPTRYEALMDLAEHLHDAHSVQRSEAMMLALTAPDPLCGMASRRSSPADQPVRLGRQPITHRTEPGMDEARPPEAHDCYTDARCCKYCQTHDGCNCDGDYYGRRYA